MMFTPYISSNTYSSTYRNKEKIIIMGLMFLPFVCFIIILNSRGALMDDAMILLCGHSFGADGIQHVLRMVSS